MGKKHNGKHASDYRAQPVQRNNPSPQFGMSWAVDPSLIGDSTYTETPAYSLGVN